MPECPLNHTPGSGGHELEAVTVSGGGRIGWWCGPLDTFIPESDYVGVQRAPVDGGRP